MLLLNTGLGLSDYYGEYEVPIYREAVSANLRQGFGERTDRFVMLDPQFGWHGGFKWWNDKLTGVIGTLSEEWNVSFAAARQRLANELAAIQLFPYHSREFRRADSWLRRLQSVALARDS